MDTELEKAKDLAVRAGAILLDHYAHPPKVAWKGLNDPVTDADRAASDFLIGELTRHFPGDGVVSEEMADSEARLARSRVWMVDPMDGTKEFIARRDEFAVMVGLAVNGRSSLGVVYQPVSRKLYYAAEGHGAWRLFEGQEVGLNVSSESDPAKLVLAVSRSHPSRRVERIRRQFGIEQTLPSGSMGLKVCLICEKRAHLYLHMTAHTFQWDTCAPEAILTEAGGRLTDLDGNALVYNSKDLRNAHGVIASNGVLHDQVVAVARQL
jgi:3'(2'), 5'-bisphosphate nucleotidase